MSNEGKDWRRDRIDDMLIEEFNAYYKNSLEIREKDPAYYWMMRYSMLLDKYADVYDMEAGK